MLINICDICVWLVYLRKVSLHATDMLDVRVAELFSMHAVLLVYGLIVCELILFMTLAIVKGPTWFVVPTPCGF